MTTSEKSAMLVELVSLYITAQLAGSSPRSVSLRGEGTMLVGRVAWRSAVKRALAAI